MNKPCEHCQKADNRKDYFECDNPCSTAKECKKNDEDFLRILRGFKQKGAQKHERRNTSKRIGKKRA